MNTPQSQIKINLPRPMKDYLQSKAAKFGVPVAGYVKHLILKDIENMDYPTYQASFKTEEAYKKAVNEYKKGKLIKMDSAEKFFDEL